MNILASQGAHATGKRERLSCDVAYALNMAIACGISYWIITHALQPLTDRDSDLLGGMWAVAATGMSPLNAWHQPLLRLIDTVVGIRVGVACKWIASHVFFRITGKPVR